ncbi:MAG: radical SAM protein [Candidatus Aminicenantes bacterium]|nr:radical SAM protein [Candidatus Aminicenantes bacterium]NIM85083.1 radical SAM protein [Candidatus Aminicenantes bacterium]NIN24590.1 radical SAM protein [Candidatus Aminicenantes bacterium]NIN48354.1 radical SAM protein [Candidatus Aminicenantes bacterium]NIN91257.1 radical SAM protein [Candidatus Aminicenantes bacterium]
MSIKLVQLPIPEVHDLYKEGNIPLAAGYLKSFAIKSGAAEEQEIEVIARDLANYAGDAAILKWVKESKTGIVGFTSYMWNIDRNLYLAQKIKEINPRITVVLGGPEINYGHRALKENHIDAVIIGEGERAFMDFLEDYKAGATIKRVYRADAPVDLTDIPNPYLEKILVPYKNESIFLETMRGCPYQCKYCFYSKSYSGLRFFPEENLSRMFELARDYRVPEIYLMDPSFNVTPGLKERLELLVKCNTTHIPIHTEIRLEGVTPGIAKLMQQAGFKSVEAGLQSVNEKSLAAIGRTWDRNKFVQGAKLLQRHGIDVKTGVILGLPYDQLTDFERTLDFVMDLSLQKSMEIYPFSMIPGTLLRDEAESLDLTYMRHPPYWVLSTKYMGEKDIKAAVEMIEHKLEIEFFPPIIPRFHNILPGYFHFLDLRKKAECQLDVLSRYPERVGHSLTLVIGQDTDMNRLREFGKWLKEANPFTLVQVVIDLESVPRTEDILRISDSLYCPDHYFNHIHHFKIDSQQKYSVRFFHLTANLGAAESYLYQPQYCDLVLRYTSLLLKKGRDILEEKPILRIDSPIGNSELKEIRRIYKGFENLLV